MAQVDYFLVIQGIEGESQDKEMKAKKAIDILSWSWGESNAGTFAGGGGGGAGKVNMQDFHFTMKVNKSTPKLIEACATGQHIKEATFSARKAGGKQETYLTIKFSDILVSSYQMGGSGGELEGTESCSLNFAKIEYEYKPQKADGTLDGAIKTGYDLKQNIKV
jgi:type VI secretion system secreted protein Hcp